MKDRKWIILLIAGAFAYIAYRYKDSWLHWMLKD